MSLFEKLFHTTHEVKALTQEIYSNHLHRQVQLTVLLPPDYHHPAFLFSHYRLLVVNDGQDFHALQMEQVLKTCYEKDQIKKIIVVGVHANHERLFEYGTAHSPDYKNRGNKAAQYTAFVLQELLPWLERQFRLKKNAEHRVMAGFSLGGLSALDIVWNQPQYFSKVGVFSGSLWWRSKAYENHYDQDHDRIMHQQVRQGQYKPGLKFWFEAGTHDETSDRNNNGIIDAIDDTLDLMKELEMKGYTAKEDFTYVEVEGGEHNQATWHKVMPNFLIWAFGK